MPDPFFSVIIPTYNRAQRIRKTIDSVLAQAFQDFELIVINDGSTDNTEEVVRAIRDPRLTCVSTPNRERAAARNSGISRSKGKYVTFLDSDDVFYPEHLARARQVLDSGSYEVYHQAYEVKDEGGIVKSQASFSASTLNSLLFTEGNVMSCLGVFIRRDVAAANPFDETRTLSGVEDWELWIRLASQYQIHHGSTVTSALVQHAGRSVSTVDAQSWMERMDTFTRIVEGNAAVRSKFADMFPVLRANISTYLALHFSESGGLKGKALQLLFRGMSQSGAAIFKRRTLAILRNLLLR